MFMPQACTAVVRGEFQHITLVAVDTAGPNGAQSVFNISGPAGDMDLAYGVANGNFADHVYTWLGVNGNAEVQVPNREMDMQNAWEHLTSTIAVEGVITKAIATVAEVSRTRWNGYSVKTGLNIADNENHGIGLAPFVMAPPAPMNVNGRVLTNLADHLANWGAINSYITVLTAWRSSPLCLMHKSVMYIGGGADHQEDLPHAAAWGTVVPEYAVCESFHVNRVLIARDIFVHSPSVTKYKFRTTRSLMTFVSETATLIGAVSNWMHSYYGQNLATVNRLYALDRHVPRQALDLLVRATNGLCVSRRGYEWAPYSQGNLINMINEISGVPATTFEKWRSLPLPWWLPEAIARKYGLVFKLSTKQRETCIGPNRADPNWFVGYQVDHNSMWATICILTSDDRYVSNGRYLVLTYEDRRYDMNSWVAWNNDLGLDYTVEIQCAPIGEGHEQRNLLQVNLQTIPFTHDDTDNDERGPNYFVSVRTPTNNDIGWMRCEGEIRYPDPVTDHMIRAGKAALPELMVGNVPGAIKTALLSAADPAITWSLNKIADISGWNLFRPGGSLSV